MDGLHDGLSCQNRTHNAQTQISRVHTDISHSVDINHWHWFEECHLTAEFTVRLAISQEAMAVTIC